MTSTVYYTHSKVVDSTAISTVYWNAKSEEMYVEFLNGTIAGYAGVTLGQYFKLCNATSVGRHYTNNVRNVYRGISGDVNLVPAPALPKLEPISKEERSAETSDKKYTVVVSVTGSLTFTVLGGSISDAEAYVVKLLDKSFSDGSYVVKSVTKNDS